MRYALMPLFAATLLGCPVDQVNCDLAAAASLTITLTDEVTGDPISDATLTFTADSYSGDCETFQAGEYICGWEVAGEITVSISKPGYEDTTITEMIEADECHVIGQQRDVALTPVCGADAGVYGVEVSVWGLAMMPPEYPINDATVLWSIGEEADEDCDLGTDNVHLCAFAREGQVTLTVSASGHDTKVIVVDVAHDPNECLPEPEKVDVTLECLAC